jgi:ATP-binding cassette, subfamily B, bacterial MsbA
LTSLLRFFREHLQRFLPLVLGGSLFMTLAAGCYGLMIATLKLVLEGNLGLSKPSVVDNLAWAVRTKSWIIAHLPAASSLRQEAYLIPVVLVLIFLVKGILTYAGTLMMVRAGIKATQSLRERLFGHLLSQEPAFFQKHPVGELIQRCITDVGAVQGIASNQLADAVRETTTAISMLVFILITDWKTSLLLFVAVPLVVIPIKRLSQRIRKINHRNMEATAGLLQRLKEVFSNIRVVLGFSREPYEIHRFHEQQHELFRLGMKSARASAMSHPIMELVGGLLLASLVFYATNEINHGRNTGSNFFTYLIAVYAFYDPLRRLTKLNNEVQVAQASLDRVYDVLDRRGLMAPPLEPKPVPLQPGSLVFEGVRFSYEGRKSGADVLRGINLSVQRGETVALVGGSGGGKTTLVNLVPRFFDPTKGRITLDGVDLRDFDCRELRHRIGIVTQETLLFMDSIHENIAYGREATREEVIQAAQRAHAHAFIQNLPKGYDTPLAETGSSLSGGQRQRIAIARALLQDPPILILDEATSALDTESERAVQEALEVLMQDRTTLVIAHRLSTVQRATRICVLKHGKIVEIGTHSELLAQNGEYARLYDLQFSHTT